MNEETFTQWFIKEVQNSPMDGALCALTAILLKNINPEQNQRFNEIVDILNNCGDISQISEVQKVKEIYDIYLAEEKIVIDNLTNVEVALAIALQKKYNMGSVCDNSNQGQNPTEESKKESKPINKWW